MPKGLVRLPGLGGGIGVGTMGQTLLRAARWVAIRARGQRGANLVEYTLLLSFILLAALAGVTAFGGGVGASLDDSAGKVITAGGAVSP